MGGQCRQTMFRKQVSRPVDSLDPHRGPRGRADLADSKKDLVTARFEVFVPYRHPSGWSRGVAKIGLFTAVALVTLTSCADPEASDQPISRGSSSPSAKASRSWVAEKFALTDCPVPDEAFCGVAVVAVNAIASGDAAALVELSRPDTYDRRCGPGGRSLKLLKEWCSFELHTVVADTGASPLEEDEFAE